MRDSPVPADAGVRRALRRATDGRTLDVTEATVLLGAHGDGLDALCAGAAGGRADRLRGGARGRAAPATSPRRPVGAGPRVTGWPPSARPRPASATRGCSRPGGRV